MDQKKFEAMLVLLVPQVFGLIVKNYGCDEVTATKEFYESKVYSILEEEDTKLWHFSPLTLFNMYDEERKTGTITFPEEGQRIERDWRESDGEQSLEEYVSTAYLAARRRLLS